VETVRRQSKVARRKSKVASLVLPLVACVLTLPAARATAQVGVPQAPRAGMTIQVLDAGDSRPVPGATVRIRSATGAEIASGTSSADGIVRVADIAAGRFIATVSAQGYGD